MNRGHVATLCRYPIKGFRAQSLSFADLRPGAGIEHDRRFGLANGQVRLALDDGARAGLRSVPRWVPCQAFVRMTQNTNLPLFGVEFHDERLVLWIRSPQGESVSADLNDPESVAACNLTLAAWFPPGPHGSPGLVEAHAFGFWDHQDAAVSIINLESVRALSRAAGAELDPLRFRGNVYLEGLPAWDELALVGQRIRVGDAELEVLRPIDRCKATSVNPSTADVDIHVPLVLSRTFGHVFCGVYARVVRPGRVSRGDGCLEIGAAPPDTRASGITDTAPPPHEWARAARVEAREVESAHVTSFWLRDPIAHLRGPWRPGQHVRIHASRAEAPEASPLWRCYTVSGATDDGLLRISVKREPGGRISSHLHDAVRAGDALVLSGPFGDFTLPEDDGALIFLSAGIGITPVAAMLRGIAQGRARPVHVVHGARNEGELSLWREIVDTVATLPHASAALYLSQPGDGACARLGAHSGRIDFERLADICPLASAHIYLCGPDAFLHDAKSAFAKMGISPERIRHEAFISPRPTSNAVASHAKPPAAGPFRVRFARSRVEATWREDSGGSLLELAEGAGLALASSCRSGVCQSCRHRVTEGTVAHLMDLLEPPKEGTALLCCAVPTSDVCIEG